MLVTHQCLSFCTAVLTLRTFQLSPIACQQGNWGDHGRGQSLESWSRVAKEVSHTVWHHSGSSWEMAREKDCCSGSPWESVSRCRAIALCTSCSVYSFIIISFPSFSILSDFSQPVGFTFFPILSPSHWQGGKSGWTAVQCFASFRVNPQWVSGIYLWWTSRYCWLPSVLICLDPSAGMPSSRGVNRTSQFSTISKPAKDVFNSCIQISDKNVE